MKFYSSDTTACISRCKPAGINDMWFCGIAPGSDPLPP